MDHACRTCKIQVHVLDALLCYALLCFAFIFKFDLLCFALLGFAMLHLPLLCYALLCFAMLSFTLLCFALLCLTYAVYTFFYTRFWTFLAFLKAPGTFSICPGNPAGEGSLGNQGRKNRGYSH